MTIVRGRQAEHSLRPWRDHLASFVCAFRQVGRGQAQPLEEFIEAHQTGMLLAVVADKSLQVSGLVESSMAHVDVDQQSRSSCADAGEESTDNSKTGPQVRLSAAWVDGEDLA